MMCCHQCCLRTPIQNQDFPGEYPKLISCSSATPPIEAFRCASPVCSRHEGMCENESFDPVAECVDCPQRTQLHACAHDALVITGLAYRDEFAAQTAHFTLDTLVACDSHDLICELFHNADPETRDDLWHRMTSCHPDRLGLLNQIFERISLPPLETGEWPGRISDYRLAIA